MAIRIQLVAAKKDFRDEELFVPENEFRAAGAEVSIATDGRGAISGMLGGKAVADRSIDEIDVDSVDAIVVAGGSGSRHHLWGNKALLEKIKEANNKGKIVAGICLSGAVIAEADVLRGKQGTVFATDESLEVLKAHGVRYVDKGVVVSGNVITSPGPVHAKEFADAILKALKERITTVTA
jgi:protease I